LRSEHERGNTVGLQSRASLGSLSTDAASQLDVFGHDSNTLGVDGAQVGVLKQADQVGLASLLKSSNSSRLEPEIGLEVLGDLPDQTLEGELADEQLGGLLVTPDLSQSNSSGPVTVGLLDAAGGGGGLPSRLGGQLLPRGLASGRLTGSLLGTSHLLPESNSNPLKVVLRLLARRRSL